MTSNSNFSRGSSCDVQEESATDIPCKRLQGSTQASDQHCLGKSTACSIFHTEHLNLPNVQLNITSDLTEFYKGLPNSLMEDNNFQILTR